jgi:hypothetical protein
MPPERRTIKFTDADQHGREHRHRHGHGKGPWHGQSLRPWHRNGLRHGPVSMSVSVFKRPWSYSYSRFMFTPTSCFIYPCLISTDNFQNMQYMDMMWEWAKRWAWEINMSMTIKFNISVKVRIIIKMSICLKMSISVMVSMSSKISISIR